MSRSKKKPNYNPDHVMQEFMAAVADAFGSYDDREDTTFPGLNAVATEFGITALKARKLLITAGVYSTALSRQVAELHASGVEISRIMKITGLSRASVHSYLPYSKIPYNLDELSANAERIRLYRERKKKCEEFRLSLPTLAGQSKQEQEVALWKLLLYLQGCVFPTAKGLKFTYKIKGGEMFVNRNPSRSHRPQCLWRIIKRWSLVMPFAGPKKLGTFGASYLYPIFVRLGVISADAG